MAQLAEAHDFYDPYGENALRWYKKSAAKCLFINHVLIDPPVDRNKARVDVKDIYLSVDKDDDHGIYVSGAKMVATGSVVTNATFVAVNSGTAARMEVGRDEEMALVFFTDMDAPGLKLICRPSYEYNAASPFDAPLASRYDENDAVMVFDQAFIPWENVLVYRDVEKCKGFYAASGFFNRYKSAIGGTTGDQVGVLYRIVAEGDRGGRHGRLSRGADPNWGVDWPARFDLGYDHRHGL